MLIQRLEERSAPSCGRKRKKRALAPLFICFSVPGPVLCKLGQPGVLFVLPEVLTQVLGPSFVLFSRAFPFHVFQPLPFWTSFPHSNYLTEVSYVRRTVVVVVLLLSHVRLLQTHGLQPASSFVHGILQGRILKWVAFSFSRRSFPPRNQTQVS